MFALFARLGVVGFVLVTFHILIIVKRNLKRYNYVCENNS